MYQMKIGNGFYYTNSYGNCFLPRLINEEALIAHNIVEFEESLRRPDNFYDGFCDGCHGTNYFPSISEPNLLECKYPCVLRHDSCQRVRERNDFPGRYDDDIGYQYYYEVFCYAVFNLCVKCVARANSIMKVSDHIASGENWIDLAHHLYNQITDNSLWKRWAGGNEIVTREAVKMMCLVDHAVNGKGQTGLFSLLPDDILCSIARHIKGVGLSPFATKIQALWRGYRIRAFPETKKWKPDCGKTLLESQRDGMWSMCDDCGMKRRTLDMFMFDACADMNKCHNIVVCKLACCYKCPDCGYTNFVKCEDKGMNGCPTDFECVCGISFILNELWWGVSEGEYSRRN